MEQIPEFDPTAPKGAFLKITTALARRRAVTWFLVNVGTKIDPHLMRWSGGRVKTTLNGPTVLLTHKGAKSGKERTAPLAYFTDGDDVIVIASAGGAPRNPAWFRNVTANPEVQLWSKGRGGSYAAAEAQGSERERLWALATGFYPGFQAYQDRATERTIPVVVCTPVGN